MRNIFVKWLIFITACFGGLAGCAGDTPNEPELTVSVAASVYDAMNEIKSVYEQRTGVTIHLNVGSSGSLRKQIERGAPVDMFVSASELQMEQLVSQEMISEDNAIPLLTNTLVLITPTGVGLDVRAFDDLTANEVGRIAIAFPEFVPAGKYAQQTLRHLDLWDLLEDKYVFGQDVRQVLSYVESGNVEAGIVYKSDAEQSEKIKIAAEADPAGHEPIVYPVGIVASSDQIDESKAFMNYLQTAEAKAIFMQYGFTPWEK